MLIEKVNKNVSSKTMSSRTAYWMFLMKYASNNVRNTNINDKEELFAIIKLIANS